MLQSFHFGDDGLAITGLQLGEFLHNHRFIGGLSEIHATAVLRALVVALAVQAGRVVDAAKNRQQVRQTDDGRVELQAHDFVVAGVAAADVFIAGLTRLEAIAIARFDVEHAANAHEHRLGAPEAAAA